MFKGIKDYVKRCLPSCALFDTLAIGIVKTFFARRTLHPWRPNAGFTSRMTFVALVDGFVGEQIDVNKVWIIWTSLHAFNFKQNPENEKKSWIACTDSTEMWNSPRFLTFCALKFLGSRAFKTITIAMVANILWWVKFWNQK